MRDTFERTLVDVALLVLVGYGVYGLCFSPPIEFPAGAYIKVSAGGSFPAIAQSFKERDVVRSAVLFRTVARVLGDANRIPAGEYFFPTRENMLSVAMRLMSGDFQTTVIKITVPEGTTNLKVASILAINLPNFNKPDFLSAVEGKEGYLFPDTYFFMPGESTEAILSVFNNGLRVHVLKIQKQITAFGKPLGEVLTMASILEKEASTLADRQKIAGVLWHRIAIGMPLQVDAVFPYYLGRNTFEVTLEDLRTDHPYNTYTNKGLPPGPIGNPGLDSMLAAVTPVKSNYIYFLSDLDGNFHFCTTYECHLANKRKYLD